MHSVRHGFAYPPTTSTVYKGGMMSARKDKSRPEMGALIVLVGVLALLAAAGGVLWLIPEGN